MSAAREEVRRVLLHETAMVVGKSWFVSCREDLRGEGRVVEGGWPGTLPEARARVAASIIPAFAQRRFSTVTSEELGRASKTTYDEARKAWLTSQDRRRGRELET